MREPKNRLQLGREIIFTANQFKRVTDRQIEQVVGLTAAQASTLHYIMEHEGTHAVYQKDIERFFGLRSASVTGMLKQLELKGLICREPEKDDARLKRIVLTEEAREIEEKIDTCIFDMEDAVSGCLSAEERLQLRIILKKVYDEIKQHDGESQKQCTGISNHRVK